MNKEDLRADDLDKNNQNIDIISPNYFTRENLKPKIKDFQIEWFNFFKNNDYSLILAPRGSGKSTTVMSYITHKCFTEFNYKILLVSNSETLAVNDGLNILNYFNRNNYGIQGYSTDHNDIKEFRFKNINSSKKENIVDCIGAGAELDSHYNCIICNDIVDNVNSATENQRRKLSNWFFDDLISTILMRGSEIHIIGTPFHANDLYKSILDDSLFSKRVYKAELKDGELLWPGRLNKQFLNLRKEQMGTELYNMQY